MGTPDSSADQTERIRLQRLSDVVASRIRQQIMSGELADGERLPRLEVLLDRFGVSAPSMREALRVLEAEGLLAVRRGSTGGSVVTVPNARTAAYTMALILGAHGTRKGDVAQAITTLEPVCARLCALRSDRGSEVVPILRALNASARKLADGDEVAYNDEMLQFHREVVRRCGNDTLALVNRALGHIWAPEVRNWMIGSVVHGRYPTVQGRLAEVQHHERVTDLIEAGDAVGAASALTAHLDDIAHYMAEGVDPHGKVDPEAVKKDR